jgi:tetratricopeptide (TPR) repeat protein
MALSHIPWTLHTEEHSNASTALTSTYTSKSSIPSNNNDEYNDSYNDSYNYPTHHYLQWRHIQNYQGAESRLASGTCYARQALDTSLSNAAHVRCVSKAHACYTQGLECYPRHVGLLTARGALYANEGEGDEARDCLERAIQYGREELDSNSNFNILGEGEQQQEQENWFHEFRTKKQVEEEVTVAKAYKKSIEEKLQVSRSRSSPPPVPAVPISSTTDHHGTSAIQWKDSAVTDALMEQQVMNGNNDNGATQNIQQWGNVKTNVPKVYTLLEEPIAIGDEHGSSSSKVKRLQTNRHRHRSLESSDDDDQDSLNSSYRNRRRRRKSSSKTKRRRRDEKRRKYKRRRGGGDESELEASNTRDASGAEESDVDSSSRHGRNRRRKRRREKSTKKHKKHRRRSYADSESDRNSHDSGGASSAKVVHE